ncbi:MAG: alpha-amylase family glycosyl hydrolase [Oscillospiraceae bacterium]|nr:alpha-amylase family glycosyl hydrolase [Oscillospiraceae bacterium]
MYIFDETDICYRNPTGPIEIPGTLTLQIRLRRKKARNPRVCFYPDGGLTQSVRMAFDHAVGDYDVYTAKISFDTAALYWYYFMAESDTADSDGGTNKAVGFTVPEQPGEAFQITAYNPEKSWPDWISGGVIYHIFVDRFARGGDVRVRSGGVYREDWGGCPYFLPDEHGIVHNNDFFGGNLYGIIQKLPYLEELGVTCIYLSPVFEADSNHKYDTGDFLWRQPLWNNPKAPLS